MALSEKDQWLIKNGDIGFQRAGELLRWWEGRKAKGDLVEHTLPMPNSEFITISAFFDRTISDGKEVPAMGCTWKSRFRLEQVTGGPVTMAADIGQNFFRRSRWQNPDGLPGGFHFIPLNYRNLDNAGDGSFSSDDPVELGSIGSKYDWLICNAVVHDFFRNSPGPKMPTFLLRRMPVMASYILMHKDYLKPYDPAPTAAVSDFTIGYSFLPVAVSKNIFGYGPGKFKAAFKQFRWTLMPNSEVEISMMFLVAPRSEKILDLGGFDPVYTLVNILNILTLNLGFGKWAHDKLDDMQLGVHARVYQSLVEGMKDMWTNRNWTAQK